MRKIISKILIKLIGRENLVDAINVDELNLKIDYYRIIFEEEDCACEEQINVRGTVVEE